MVLDTGEPYEKLFDGVIKAETAFQIGRFITMALFLNERANSAWVHYTPIKVGFIIKQDSEIGMYWVYVRLENVTRSTLRQIESYSTREAAEKFVVSAQKLIVDNPI